MAGPPCAGKSTLAWSLAEPGDVVLDLDRICQELGSPVTHGHPLELLVDAELEMQRRMRSLHLHYGNAYVIRSAPRAQQRAVLRKMLRATVWVINPGFTECVRRAEQDNRPEQTADAIADWYRLYRPSSVDAPCPHFTPGW